MPKQVSYIQCDECAGRLLEIARTNELVGANYDDASVYTVFHQCDKCGALYFEHSYNNGNIDRYEGKLTGEEIIKFAPTISGTFDDEDDELAILVQLRPQDVGLLEITGEVEKDGTIWVGQALAGKKVNVTVQLVL